MTGADIGLCRRWLYFRPTECNREPIPGTPSRNRVPKNADGVVSLLNVDAGALEGSSAEAVLAAL